MHDNRTKKFKIDYLSKYYFYELDEFKKEEDSDYILEKINECNRFDYKGYTYKYSKYNNIVKGKTKKNIDIIIDESDDNVTIEGKKIRLDLNYKYQIKQLEDHVRVATKLCDNINESSCLIYIDNDHSKEFLNSLENIKDNQVKLMENKLQQSTIDKYNKI